MKNLKFLVIPLISASFLFSCGSKSIDAEAFIKKVSENYHEEIFTTNYVGKTLYVTGSKTDQLEVKAFEEDVDFGYFRFYYTSSESVGLFYLNYIDSDVLSVDFVSFVKYKMEVIKELGADTKISYFIANDTYIVETSVNKVIGSVKGEMLVKYVFNKDLVITHYEERHTATEEPMQELKYDFKYE